MCGGSESLPPSNYLASLAIRKKMRRLAVSVWNVVTICVLRLMAVPMPAEQYERVLNSQFI